MSKVSVVSFAGRFVAALLIASFAMTTSAAEKLDILQDTEKQFAGSYKADEHVVAFNTALQDESVRFTIEIDGLERSANFSLEGTQLELTTGDTLMSETEKELMYDTAKTLVDYVNRQEAHELNDHLVVLVGVMNYWSSLSLVN
jgi:hypothetical protein